MMTSRSEYRLLHRQDNADIRLSEIGHKIGLISDEAHEAVLEKYRQVETEIQRLEKTHTGPVPELCELMESRGTTPPNSGVSIADLIRRPQLDYECVAPFDKGRPELSAAVKEQVEISLKYSGYIEKQVKQVEEFRRMESRLLPDDIDYLSIHGIRMEAREKLDMIRPRSVGQASRISGVSPADLAALMIFLGK